LSRITLDNLCIYPLVLQIIRDIVVPDILKKSDKLSELYEYQYVANLGDYIFKLTSDANPLLLSI
jgi:hypothetical protein